MTIEKLEKDPQLNEKVYQVYIYNSKEGWRLYNTKANNRGYAEWEKATSHADHLDESGFKVAIVSAQKKFICTNM